MMNDLFSVEDIIILLTGGGGVLAGAVAEGLGKAGACVVLTDIAPLEERVDDLKEKGIKAYGFRMDVLNKQAIEAAAAQIQQEVGSVDVLINMAGGNVAEASTSETQSFFDLPIEGLQKVIMLNLFGGAILPSQVFGKQMVANKQGGNIINISSVSSFKPLTKVGGYSAAKAAVNNFTQWLAVHIAQEYSSKVRVNAIAPGFFLTKQNRYLLQDDKGNLTSRGESVIAHTPMKRFGIPEDLVGAIIWLASPASSFVTGAVIPVDGGFTAFGGV